MAHTSLYRRYRPQRFADVVGQDHVVTALRNAVAEDRVGHAYLFSGPRGTGKTSTARILAKALNCEALVDGEPCDVCASCVAIREGTSLDVHELDAASNNGVAEVRDLVGSAALGTPGRTKVYVLDEVHMLSKAASNALLKTLEEPPGHVVFVLATTDPQKVLPTIRSRTQHFEFRLLTAGELGEHVRSVASDAGIDVDDDAVDSVVRRGGGSARDTLSALDQVAAGGSVADPDAPVDALVTALAARDAAAAIRAIAEATAEGVDPRDLAEALARHLRDAFLVSVGGAAGALPEAHRERLEADAGRLGSGTIVRSLESLGSALVDLRQANDPRLAVEVALLRLTADPLTDELAAVRDRLDRLEAGVPAAVGAPAAPTPTEASPPPPDPADPPRSRPAPSRPRSAPGGQGPAAAARAQLAGKAPAGGAMAPPAAPPPPPPSRESAPPASRSTDEPPAAPDEAPAAPDEAPASAATAPTAPARGPAAEADVPERHPPVASEAAAAPDQAPAPAPSATGAGLDLDELRRRWDDGLHAALTGRARALYGAGHFVAVEGDTAAFALPNGPHMARCESVRRDVEGVLAEQLGRPVSLVLMVEGDPVPPLTDGDPSRPNHGTTAADDLDDEAIDPDELVDVEEAATDPVGRVRDAFPGAELIDEMPEGGHP